MGEFVLQVGKRIAFGAMASTGLEDFMGVCQGKNVSQLTPSRTRDNHKKMNLENHTPAPTKLYLPIVSVVAALS